MGVWAVDIRVDQWNWQEHRGCRRQVLTLAHETFLVLRKQKWQCKPHSWAPKWGEQQQSIHNWCQRANEMGTIILPQDMCYLVSNIVEQKSPWRPWFASNLRFDVDENSLEVEQSKDFEWFTGPKVVVRDNTCFCGLASWNKVVLIQFIYSRARLR